MKRGSFVFGVDVEPWGLTRAAGKLQNPDKEGKTKGLEILEAILGRHKAHVTFFVPALWARRHPADVRRISEAGHEISSHGQSRRTPDELGRQVFLQEIRDSRKLLEDLTGKPVLGYRCPNGGVTPEVPWALPCIQRAGYLYDASIISGSKYPWVGTWKGAKPGLRTETLSEKHGLALFVNPSLDMGSFGLPWSVGLFFRLIPMRILKKLVEQQGGQFPTQLSVHDWELAPPASEDLEGLGWLSRLSLSLGAGAPLARKLDDLFDWGDALRFCDALEEASKAGVDSETG